jgi:hypothetical protein
MSNSHLISNDGEESVLVNMREEHETDASG